MSLFRISEWYTNLYPAASCIAVGTFIENRDQVIIGGEDGVLTVLDPGGTEKDPILLEQEIGKPVIDIIIGEFLPPGGTILAVLTPRLLSYFRLSYDALDLSRTKLEQMFSHEMPEHAYNMCAVPSPSTQQILVQSIGCVLTLYQGDQCVFSRSPLPALHPGPLSYCYPSSSLVTSNGGRLHSVKFSLLAGLGNTGKRVTFDWTFHLGDTCIDMAMEDAPPIQPSIICLCRYTVYCLSTGGTVRWQIRLEQVGTALMVYSVGKEAHSIRLCVATSSNTLLVFSDYKLMWNSQTEGTVISLKLSNFNSTYQNVLSMLSNEGKVSIGYLGTEPNLYKVPVDNRFIDFKAKIQELREIEASVKDTGNIGPEKKTSLVMKCTPGELEKATIEYETKQGAPICPLVITLQGTDGADTVKVNVRSTLCTSSKQFVLDHPGDTETLKIAFFVGDNIPTSTTVHVAAHCSGTQATAFASIRIPFAVMFAETSPERNAAYKLTLDSDQTCVPLNTLFHEFQTENPTSIGFRVHGYDVSVSVFTAQKSNRYRIQTDHLQLLNVVVTELVERVQAAQHGVQLHANIPMHYVSTLLDQLVELGSRSKVQNKVIADRSREMRAIEALILSKTRNTKPETFEHIDLLYGDAHEQLFAAIDELTSIRAEMQNLHLTLASLFDLISMLLRLEGLETVLNGNFITDTNQTLEEHLAWASQIANDPSRAVAVLCQHQRKDLPQIKEEEEEEDDFDNIQTGEIKL
ncbi:hypothetical protein RB195_008039 [Necator americanus]|uniref:PTHB1 N-terminal domain-containing protein n=1 Tax=Necator americanus TaxID=51031 RepID=A0ABR1C045_NECAM